MTIREIVRKHFPPPERPRDLEFKMRREQMEALIADLESFRPKLGASCDCAPCEAARNAHCD